MHGIRRSALLALAALSLSCLVPGDPYPHDNSYDPNSGTFLLLWEIDDSGVVTLHWSPPSYRLPGDQAVVLADDELDGAFAERGMIDLAIGEYTDSEYPLAEGGGRDYLVGVRRNGDSVKGTSNWIRVSR